MGARRSDSREFSRLFVQAQNLTEHTVVPSGAVIPVIDTTQVETLAQPRKMTIENVVQCAIDHGVGMMPISTNVQVSGMVLLQDIRKPGVEGGTSVANQWVVRDVGSVMHDPDSICKLLSPKVFQLPSGTYHISHESIYCGTYQTATKMTVTNSKIGNGDICVSPQYYFSGKNMPTTMCRGEGVVYVDRTSAFRLKYYSSKSVSKFGLGGAYEAIGSGCFSTIKITPLT